jgi:hypothetical protein
MLNKNKCNYPENVTSYLSTFIIHYSPLKQRRNYIESSPLVLLNPTWITETIVTDHQSRIPALIEKNNLENEYNFCNLSHKKLARKLLANSYSSTQRRRKAHFKAAIASKLPRSFFPKLTNTYSNVYNDLTKYKVSNQVHELVWMHIAALLSGIAQNTQWILVLEDDSILNEDMYPDFRSDLLSIISKIRNEKTIIFLNSSRDMENLYNKETLISAGLYQVKPRTARNASAYMISYDFAIMLVSELEDKNNKMNFPPDYMLDIACEKFKIKTYWQNPPMFPQGSETGYYESHLEGHRVEE